MPDLSGQDFLWSLCVQSNRKNPGAGVPFSHSEWDGCFRRVAALDGVAGLCTGRIRPELSTCRSLVPVAGSTLFAAEGTIHSRPIARGLSSFKSYNASQ